MSLFRAAQCLKIKFINIKLFILLLLVVKKSLVESYIFLTSTYVSVTIRNERPGNGLLIILKHGQMTRKTNEQTRMSLCTWPANLYGQLERMCIGIKAFRTPNLYGQLERIWQLSSSVLSTQCRRIYSFAVHLKVIDT